jgi:hypothetical protein
MVITKGRPGYTPITIVLTTELEAKIMWTALNVSSSYLTRVGAPYKLGPMDSYAMWEEFDKVYNPTELR